MKNLDLTQILKDCPKGTKFYSMVDGEVEFVEMDSNNTDRVFFTEHSNCLSFYKDGRAYKDRGECVLFPSKDQRDWSKFKAPNKKVKVTLHPFDKVLAWSAQPGAWVADIFSHYDSDDVKPIRCIGGFRGEVIPYNKDTAHLLGTSDKPKIEYEIEFSKE